MFKTVGGVTTLVEYVPAVAKIGDTEYASLQDALDAAEAADTPNIVIDLVDDATLDITAWNGAQNALSIGTANTQSITINGNNHKLTFNQKNSDWNNVATMNDAQTKLILNDMSISNSGCNDGPWNRHDINFNCAVELNNVTSDKALAFKNAATLNNVTVADTGDIYGIWIRPTGQPVAIDGLTLTCGRGIKIDDEYKTPTEDTTLTIKDATFNTTGTKSAILVKSSTKTTINASGNINISNVAADSTNLVWVDEDVAERYSDVTVTGATVVPEKGETHYVASVVSGGSVKGYYGTLAEAITAAEADDTVAMHQAGTYTLPNLPKNITIEGKVEGVIFEHIKQNDSDLTTGRVIASVPNGATFKNVKFVLGAITGVSANYHGFTQAGKIVMDGCSIDGLLFSYGNMVFTNCNFHQNNKDYHMWVYGPSTVEYTGCTFVNEQTGKFINVYRENSQPNVVKVSACKFINNGTASKAALNVKSTSGNNPLTADVIVDVKDCSTEGAFPTTETSDATGFIDAFIQIDDEKKEVSDKVAIAEGTDIVLDENNKITGGIYKVIDTALIAPGYISIDNPNSETSATYPLIIDGPYVAVIYDENGALKKGYATLAAAIAAAQNGDTIKLIADLTQDDGVIFNKANVSVTLDLNGKTFTVNNGANCNNRAIQINNGTLTVTNGSIVAVGSGTTSSNGTGCFGAFRVESAGTLYAENVNLSNARPWGLNVKVIGGKAYLTNVTINSSYGGGIEVTEASLGDHSQAGYAELTGCTFTQTGYFDHCSTALSVSGGSELVVNSGTYTSENYGLYVFSSGGNITVKGGTFTGNKAVVKAAIDTNTYPNYTGAVQISGGTFTGALDVTSPASMAVSGGNFDRQVPANYCAEDYVPTTEPVLIDNVPYYTVTTMGVAKIECTGEATQYFPTLEAAIGVAQSGDTITLLADVEQTAVITIGKTVTLDLNGKSVTGSGSLKSLFNINANGVFSVNDSVGGGKISNTEQTINFSAAGNDTTTRGGKFVLQGGIIENTADGTTQGNSAIHSANGNSQIEILGGSVSGKFYGIYLNATAKSVNGIGYVNVSGGTITGGYAAKTAAAAGVFVSGTTITVEDEGRIIGMSSNGAASAIRCSGTTGSVKVKGGSICSHNNGAAIYPASGWTYEVSGGWLSEKVTTSSATAVPAGYCTEGYVPSATTKDDFGDNLTYHTVAFAEAAVLTPIANTYPVEYTTVYHETVAEAIAAANGGDTVKIRKDVDLGTNGRITASNAKSYTIDLDGKTITGRVTISEGTVVVKNGTIVGRFDVYDSATVTVANDATIDGYVVVWGDGTYGEEGCKTPTFNLYGKINSTDSTALFNGSDDTSKPSINIYEGAVIDTTDWAVILNNDAELTMTGGSITAKRGIDAMNGGSIKVSGGQITTTESAIGLWNGSSVEISGGTITAADFAVFNNGNSTNADTTMIVTGGTLTSANSAAIYHAGPGSLSISQAEGKTTAITGKTGVEMRAGSLSISGGTITEMAPELTVAANGNGETITGAAVAISQHTTEKPINVSISGGTFDATAGGVALYETDTVASETPSADVTATVTGGTFYGPVTTQNEKITIPGAILVGDEEQPNPARFSEKDDTQGVLADYKLVQVPGSDPVMYKIVPKDYVVKAVDGEGHVLAQYESLQEAFDNAPAGSTLQPLADLVLTEMATVKNGKDVNLDLAGKSITAASGEAWTAGDMLLCVNYGGTLAVTNSGAEATGVIDATTNGKPDGKLYGAIKLTSKGDNAANGTATFVLNGGTVKGTNYGISGNGGRPGTAVTVNGGKVVATGNATDREGNAIYNPQNGTVTINGGEVEGWTAVYAKSGKVTVNGGTLTGNGEAVAYGYYGNGGYSTGDALVIETCGYPGGAPAADIKGGTFISANAKAVGSYAKDDTFTALAGFIDPEGKALFSDAASDGVPAGYRLVESGTAGLYKVAAYPLTYLYYSATNPGVYDPRVTPVPGVSVQQVNVKVKRGDETASRAIAESDSDLTVTWAVTEGGDIATVDATGMVSFTAGGSAKVSVTVADALGNTFTKTATVRYSPAVAAIGDQVYGTLSAAISAAQPGETVTLLADQSLSGIFNRFTIAKEMTLDLGGKTLNMNGAYFTLNEGADLTVKNGTITAKGNMSQEFTVNAGSLTIASDATVSTAGNVSPIGVFGPATINTSGTLEAANSFAIAGNGSAGKGGYTINVTGGSITSAGAAAIYSPNVGTVNVSGGTVSGKTGIEVRAGTLNVTGGMVKETATELTVKANGNGTTVTGAAVAISQHTTEHPITVNISGGTLDAKAGGVALYEVDTVASETPSADVTATVTGGTFYGSVTNENGTITIPGTILVGGEQVPNPARFSEQEKTQGVHADYKLVPEEGSDPVMYKIVPKVYVVQNVNTEVKYETLAEAFAAANTGDTVKLLADITYGTDKEVDVFTKAVNLDLGGFTLKTQSTVSTTEGNNGYKAAAVCYSIEGSDVKKVTVSNGSIETAYGAGVYADGLGLELTLANLTIRAATVGTQTTKEYSSAVRITSNAKVVIANGTYTGPNAIAVSNSGGRYVINGGDFDGDLYISTYANSGVAQTVEIADGKFKGNFVKGSGEFAISGGVFSVQPEASYPASGYVVVDNADAATKDAYPYTVAETIAQFVYPIEGTTGLPIPSGWLAANSVGGYSDAEQPILATMTNAMVTALSGKADNGMPMWQSYVLGLTPNGANATALRLAATAKDATTVTITAAVNVPATLENSGTTVSFRLVEQNADGTWTDIEAGKASPSFDVSLDDVAGKVLTIFADIVTE